MSTQRSIRRIALVASTALAGGLFLAAMPVFAQNLPDTGNVTSVTAGLSGGAPGSTNPVISTSGAAGSQTMQIGLHDNRTIMNWGGTGFNVAAGNTVNFADARATSGVSGRTDNIAVLNRDMSGQLSNIYGMITSDPNVAVYVINSNGINFGPSSVVNTGSFFASTLDLTDTNFLNNPTSLAFSASTSASISLAAGAQIHTTATSSTDGGRIGDLVLMSGTVFGKDAGSLRSLTATNGDIGIVTANAVTIQNSPGSPLAFTVTRGSSEGLATTLVDIAANISGRNVTVATAKDGPGNLGQGIRLDGSLTATGVALTDHGVVLTAGRDAPGVTMGASFTRADSGSYVELPGSISSSSGVTIRTGDGVSMDKSLVAAGAVVIDASYLNDFDAVGVTGSDVTLPYRTYVAGKTTATNGNITITPGAGDHSGGVSLLGGAEATGDITAYTGEFTAGDLVAGGSINLSVVDGTFNGKVHAIGPVIIDLPSVYGRLSFGGVVSSDGDVRITAPGHLNGGNFIAGGALYLEGDLNLTAGDVSGANGVTLISDGFSGASSIYDNGRIRINSVSTGDNGDVYIRALQLFGTNDGRTSSLIAGRNIEIDTGFIDVATIKGLSGSVKLMATNPSTTYGNYIRVDNIFAGTTLTGSSLGGLTILNATAQTGDMTLTGSSAILGSSTVLENFAVSGNLTINSSGTVQLRGNLVGGGDLNATGTNISFGSTGVPGTEVRVRGAINLTAMTSNVTLGGSVLLQSNSDGIGNEALTLDAKTMISAASATLLGGPGRQSDVQFRVHTGVIPTTIFAGAISARGILSAVDTAPFAAGINGLDTVQFRAPTTLTNSLTVSATNLSFGNITVTNGDIDLRAASAVTLGGVLNASGDVGVRTSSGDLTIAAAGQAIGRNVTLSTPGAFINQRGADAVTASGHWVIYSANPAGDTFAGLDSGNTALWNATLATRDPSTISGNRYVFSIQPTLTFTSVDFSKVYGTDRTNGGAPFTVTGFQPGVVGAFLGDTVATAYSGKPLISSAGFATHASVAGGPYTTTVSQGSLSSSAGYAFAFSSPGMVTVTPKALTGTVTIDTRAYDGTTSATGTVGLNGVVSGDSVGTTGSVFAFLDKNAGAGKTVTVSGTMLNGGDAGNYTLTMPASALGDILKKALTSIVSVDNKTYDGTTAATGTLGISGVLTGETVGTTGTAFSFADKNAGTGKTVIISGTTLTGADAGNYSLTLPTNVIADIFRKALTGTVTVDSKTYDGTATGTGMVGLSGVVDGDHVGTTGSAFTFADKNAGAGKTVTITGTTLNGDDAGNYTLTLPATALADILKKALTGTVTANSKTYDGTTAATGTIGLSGIVSGDDVRTSGSAFAFADKNAGAGKTVNVSGTTLSGADAGNYTLTLPASALADILQKALTGTITVNNKTYDGTTTGTGSVSLSGVVSGDNVGTTGSAFTFADKNAGVGKTVTVTGTSLSGNDAGNYTLTLPATALADILQKALTGTITVNAKTYDGTTAATGSVALSGVVSGEDVGTTGSVFAFADKNAGAGKTVNVSGTSLTGGDAGNYTLTIPATALADILKKALTGTITVNGKTYDGTTAATGSVSLAGVLAGETVGTTGSVFTFADKNAGTGKTVTVSGTTLNGADAGNYTLTLPASALADILQKALTGTITVNNKTYDGTIAGTGSVGLSGVVSGDNVGTTGSAFTFADKNAGVGKTVAVTGTSLNGSDAGNYTLTLPATALADILQKALTGTITINTKTYDGTTAATGSVGLSGVVSGDSVGTTGSSFAFADKNAGTGKTVNVSGTVLNGADAGNYTLTIPTSALADILKKALTGTITVNGKTYDGTTATTGSVSLAGVLAGETVGTTGSVFTFADKNAGTGKTVNVSGTTLNGADAGNYTLTLPASALADILKRALTAQADDKTKHEGETDPALTFTITSGSLVTGDTLAGALARAAGEQSGSYAITQGTLSGGQNYDLTFHNGNFTITARPAAEIPLQPLHSVVLPGQLPDLAPAQAPASVDSSALCGKDPTCVTSN